MSQTGVGSHAGNSSSVKGDREQSILGQGSGRANKTSTEATDFLPLSCHSIIYCRAAEKQLLQLSTWLSPLIQRAMHVLILTDTQIKKYQLSKNKCRQLNIFVIKINFPQKLSEKGSYLIKEIVQEKISMRL